MFAYHQQTHRNFCVIGILLRKLPVIDYRPLDRIGTTFILSVTRFQCLPISAGYSVPSCLWQYSYRDSLLSVAGTLIGYKFLLLFRKNDTGIYWLLSDYFGENNFYIVPRVYPHPSNYYYTVTTSYDTFPHLWKVWPNRGYSHSRLRTPLLGHLGGISPFWLSYVFAPMRGKSSTCD